ncbi:MAG TPA: RnfABCDGE type electron transport complex subunit B [Casimicrobiaceae bacterium]|nr:RnfABCDGE type electron transport complex subunit B [Casimicrobiaceae bacterium]
MSPPTSPSLADRLDSVLPQTQCRRCGYDGCRPYAEAIADGAPINRCPPGADIVVAMLASITGRPVAALDPECGNPGPLRLARIDEASCIGCTLCIDACPVDAIVGAAKRMHTVLAAVCTGCELCVAACPVDCIAMVAAGRVWSVEEARAAADRYRARIRRIAATASKAPSATPADGDRAKRQAAVAAALARARARRASLGARAK